MKKLLTVLIAALLIAALPYNLTFGQAPEPPPGATQFFFLGYDQSGQPGVSFSVGFTFGKVTVLPFTRFALSDSGTSIGGINYEKSIGVEFIYWAFEGTNWKVGAIAGPGTVEWMEQQDIDLPQIVSQSIGLAGVYDINENLSAAVALKGTDQLMGPDSPFRTRFRVVAGLKAKLQLFGS